MPMRPLNERELEIIAKATALNTISVGLENAKKNKSFAGKSILDIIDNSVENAAILISAGPSLRKRGHVKMILESGFDGPVVCVDAALPYCLMNGLVPDYVVSVDEDPTRIVRWYGDPELGSKKYDDYYKRKYGHGKTREEEIRDNEEYIKLVNKYAPKIKAVLATSIDNNVTRRCVEAGFDIYWWNPMYDDYENPNSATRQAYRIVPVPALMTGGNVGASAWVFCHTILKRNIGIVGMDFGYVADSSMSVREMGDHLKETFGESAEEAFIEIFNPYTKEKWNTDATFYWYRECFLKILKELDVTAYNCTEGGILFGDGVINITLKEFLEKFSNNQ